MWSLLLELGPDVTEGQKPTKFTATEQEGGREACLWASASLLSPQILKIT